MDGTVPEGVLPLPSLGKTGGSLNAFRAFREIFLLCRDLRPDIVHTHFSKAGFLGRWAAWIEARRSGRRVRIVHAPHGDGSKSFEKISALVTDRWVALTPGERDDFLSSGVGRPSRWTVVPAGVDWDEDVYHRRHARRLEVRRSLSIPETAMVAGGALRLDPGKGALVLAAAAERLFRERKDLFFLLVGDGSERAEVEAARARLPDPSRFVLAGRRDDPFFFMTAMDVFVHPCRNMGSGKALVLAQAMGLPVVAGRVDGVPDLVEDGEAGVLVPSGDSEALVQTLRRLLDDPALRERLGAAGRERVTTFGEDGFLPFSVERMVDRLEKIYASLV